MDFWARQAESKQRTRWLVVLYVAAVAAIVVAVNLVVLFAIAVLGANQGAVPDVGWLARNPKAIWLTSLSVLAFIGIGSLSRTVQLAAGGGVVARSLGGQRVQADTTDPLEQRLRNVVEEMAIAAGVPVPALYVLNEEAGINAFAAGHTTANAAIGVTRGALENLERAELQGVIGHEFSHILNGDMRLNMRLVGLLHGLVMLAVVGRTLFSGLSGGGRRRVRISGGGAVAVVIAVAAAITALGHIGVFFGRLIQSAVSRQREFLADASAVQFNRDVTGLRDALVKIGQRASSRLHHPEVESAAHMLFAPGTTQWFATHPPLAERIRALDPHFDVAAALRLEVKAQPLGVVRVVRDEATPQSFAQPAVLARQFLRLDPSEVPARVANPGRNEVAEARRMRARLDARWSSVGAHKLNATALLLALALDADEPLGVRQLVLLTERLGATLADSVRANSARIAAIDPAERLPLLGRLLPALRELPIESRAALIDCLAALAAVDGKVAIFEFTLAVLARTWLGEGLYPAQGARPVRLAQAVVEAQTLLSILAAHGHEVAVESESAYSNGIERLGLTRPPPFRPVPGWAPALERSLRCLDGLPSAEKARLIEAIAATITHDGAVTVNEGELLRAICALLHCPLPPLVDGDSNA